MGRCSQERRLFSGWVGGSLGLSSTAWGAGVTSDAKAHSGSGRREGEWSSPAVSGPGQAPVTTPPGLPEPPGAQPRWKDSARAPRCVHTASAQWQPDGPNCRPSASGSLCAALRPGGERGRDVVGPTLWPRARPTWPGAPAPAPVSRAPSSPPAGLEVQGTEVQAGGALESRGDPRGGDGVPGSGRTPACSRAPRGL